MGFGIGAVRGEVGSQSLEQKSCLIVLFVGFTVVFANLGKQSGVVFEDQVELATDLFKQNFQVGLLHGVPSGVAIKWHDMGVMIDRATVMVKGLDWPGTSVDTARTVCGQYG
jgi:hypothetical protein